MSKMSNMINLKAYKAGVRLQQFLMLLAGEASIPKVELESALSRVRLSLHELEYEFMSLTTLREFFGGETIRNYVSAWDNENPRDRPLAIIARGNEFINHFKNDLGEENSDTQDWFSLGFAIADGYGIINFPDNRCLHQGPSVRIRPSNREWCWADSQTVTNLLERLHLNQNEVFPKEEVFRSSDDSIFPELNFDDFWGWIAIEKGLLAPPAELRTPRWDNPTRKLYWYDNLVHRFQTIAINQMTILEEFESNNWATHITIPESSLCPGKRAQTINDLNVTLRRAFRSNSATFNSIPEIRLALDSGGVCWSSEIRPTSR